MSASLIKCNSCMRQFFARYVQFQICPVSLTKKLLNNIMIVQLRVKCLRSFYGYTDTLASFPTKLSFCMPSLINLKLSCFSLHDCRFSKQSRLSPRNTVLVPVFGYLRLKMTGILLVWSTTPHCSLLEKNSPRFFK